MLISTSTTELNTINGVLEIPKELIGELKFPKQEVLSTNDDIIERYHDIRKAVLLGNIYRSKVSIYFKDDTCQLKVNTTIWAITDHEVILKRNLTIPINRIIKIGI